MGPKTNRLDDGDKDNRLKKNKRLHFHQSQRKMGFDKINMKIKYLLKTKILLKIKPEYRENNVTFLIATS